MSKSKFLLLFFLFANLGYGQILNLDDPRLRIDFWLENYTQVTQGEKYNMAKRVFQNLMAVADKPTGVLPELYIFSDLELGQVFALPDGSIILPMKVIDLCLKHKEGAEARLAFVLGHEIKHVVRGDYWIIQHMLEFAKNMGKEQQNTQWRRLWDRVQWDQYLRVRKAIETEADEYGILYASMAGYDVRAIISPSNSFISDYYRAAGMDIHGDLTANSVEERLKAVNRRLRDIIEHLDLFDFGVRLYAIDQYDAAIELFRKFITRYPSREVFNNLGACYYQKARMYYEKWKHKDLDKDPNLVFKVSVQIDPVSRIQVTRRGIERSYHHLFQEAIKKSIENFEKARERDTTYEIALNNLGCAYLLKGDVDFAKGYFKKAIELNPYYKEAYNNLGIAYFVEGNMREAVTHFLAAHSLKADYPDPIYNLGQLNYQTGQFKEAAKYFNQYLQLDTSSAWANVVRKHLGIRTPVVSVPVVNERINGRTPSQTSWLAGEAWKQFRTPSAIITVLHDAGQNTRYFQVVSAQSRISIILAAKGYQGSSERGIRIGDPETLVEKRYPYPHAVRATTTGVFWIYNDFKLVFEMRDHRVYSWYLFDIL